MEKQQHFKTWNNALEELQDFELYFNETFKD
jgi:hypothetical protein